MPLFLPVKVLIEVLFVDINSYKKIKPDRRGRENCQVS